MARRRSQTTTAAPESDVVNVSYPKHIADQISINWFCKPGGAGVNFTRHVLPRTVHRYLEVGTWAGASLFWMLHHKRPTEAIAIDPYPADRKRSQEHNRELGATVRRLWHEHYRETEGRLIEVPSERALPELLSTRGPGAFDLVYIDGSHHGADVFFDAAVGSRLVRPGGLLILDDFRAARRGNVQGLRLAVDAFYRAHADDFRVVFRNRQVGLERRPASLRALGHAAGVGGSLLEPGEYEHATSLIDNTADGILRHRPDDS